MLQSDFQRRRRLFVSLGNVGSCAVHKSVYSLGVSDVFGVEIDGSSMFLSCQSQGLL